jgi:hypothetical protein
MPGTCTHRPGVGRALAVLVLFSAFALTSCGSSIHHTASLASSTHAVSPAPRPGAVVRIGKTAISSTVYAHWMAIGAATVEMAKPTGPLPAVIEYVPPAFAACIAHRRSLAKTATITSLRAECRKIYEQIQARVLNFLITGYWLREQAAQIHLSVSQAEVRRKFNEDRQQDFPSATAFQRLKEASRQSVPDLEFAVETQMLSTRLLKHFTAHLGKAKTEQATIAAFNRYIASRWTRRTTCRPAYIVKDCKQYKLD